jgi:radical SAM superfamily enzyme YgiQ (UPF0313 family)
MKKILLVSTHEDNPRSFLKPPGGLICLKKYIELHNEDWQIEIIDPEIIEKEFIFNKVYPQKWDLVGFYTNFPTIVNSIELIKKFVQVQNEAKPIIIAGGPGILFENIFDISDIDIAIYGEGEKTFYEFAKIIVENEIKKCIYDSQIDLFKKIQGFYKIKYQEKGISQKYICESYTILNNDELNQMITPHEWEYNIHIPYIEKTAKYLLHDYGYPLFSTRGCSSSGCTFCSSHSFFRSKERSHRYPNSEIVVRAIEKIQNANIDINYIIFEDDSFLCSKTWVEEFCNLVEQYKEIGRIKKEFAFIIKARLELLDNIMIKRLSEIGVRQINVGIESASEKVLLELGKTKKTKEYIEKTKLMTEKKEEWHKIKFHCYFIFFSPYTTTIDLIKTIKLAIQLLQAGIEISCYDSLLVLPGNKYYEDWKNDIRLKSKEELNQKYYYKQRIINGKEILFPVSVKCVNQNVNEIFENATKIYNFEWKKISTMFDWKASISYRKGIVYVYVYLKSIINMKHLTLLEETKQELKWCNRQLNSIMKKLTNNFGSNSEYKIEQVSCG